MTGRGQVRAQTPAGVKQVLVDGVSGGVELQREDVDGYVIERHSDEDLSLMLGQLLDPDRQRGEPLPLLGLPAGPWRQRVRDSVELELGGGGRIARPRVSADL